jgi:hypothetical protein
MCFWVRVELSGRYWRLDNRRSGNRRNACRGRGGVTAHASVIGSTLLLFVPACYLLFETSVVLQADSEATRSKKGQSNSEGFLQHIYGMLPAQGCQSSCRQVAASYGGCLSKGGVVGADSTAPGEGLVSMNRPGFGFSAVKSLTCFMPRHHKTKEPEYGSHLQHVQPLLLHPGHSEGWTEYNGTTTAILQSKTKSQRDVPAQAQACANTSSARRHISSRPGASLRCPPAHPSPCRLPLPPPPHPPCRSSRLSASAAGRPTASSAPRPPRSPRASPGAPVSDQSEGQSVSCWCHIKQLVEPRSATSQHANSAVCSYIVVHGYRKCPHRHGQLSKIIKQSLSHCDGILVDEH